MPCFYLVFICFNLLSTIYGSIHVYLNWLNWHSALDGWQLCQIFYYIYASDIIVNEMWFISYPYFFQDIPKDITYILHNWSFIENSYGWGCYHCNCYTYHCCKWYTYFFFYIFLSLFFILFLHIKISLKLFIISKLLIRVIEMIF